MSDLLDALNDEQRMAVENTEGYVRLHAGAGTGKTRTLTYRYAYLVSVLGVPAKSVWCCTFTNRAAAEMKARIISLCGDVGEPFVSTFHSFCVHFLKEEIMAIGWPKNFTIWDVNNVKAVLKPIYDECKIDGREFPLRKAWEFIDTFKEVQDYIPAFIASDTTQLIARSDAAQEPGQKIFWRYLFAQRTSYALDFDDLILCTLHILRQFPEIRERWQERLEYIMVDEFQDIDRDQYELVEILAGKNHNLFIVGDPDQTIYSWRGARVEYFNDFIVRHGGKPQEIKPIEQAVGEQVLDEQSKITNLRAAAKVGLLPLNPSQSSPANTEGKTLGPSQAPFYGQAQAQFQSQPQPESQAQAFGQNQRQARTQAQFTDWAQSHSQPDSQAWAQPQARAQPQSRAQAQTSEFQGSAWGAARTMGSTVSQFDGVKVEPSELERLLSLHRKAVLSREKLVHPTESVQTPVQPQPQHQSQTQAPTQSQAQTWGQTLDSAQVQAQGQVQPQSWGDAAIDAAPHQGAFSVKTHVENKAETEFETKAEVKVEPQRAVPPSAVAYMQVKATMDAAHSRVQSSKSRKQSVWDDPERLSSNFDSTASSTMSSDLRSHSASDSSRGSLAKVLAVAGSRARAGNEAQVEALAKAQAEAGIEDKAQDYPEDRSFQGALNLPQVTKRRSQAKAASVLANKQDKADKASDSNAKLASSLHGPENTNPPSALTAQAAQVAQGSAFAQSIPTNKSNKVAKVGNQIDLKELLSDSKPYQSQFATSFESLGAGNAYCQARQPASAPSQSQTLDQTQAPSQVQAQAKTQRQSTWNSAIYDTYANSQPQQDAAAEAKLFDLGLSEGKEAVLRTKTRRKPKSKSKSGESETYKPQFSGPRMVTVDLSSFDPSRPMQYMPQSQSSMFNENVGDDDVFADDMPALAQTQMQTPPQTSSSAYAQTQAQTRVKTQAQAEFHTQAQAYASAQTKGQAKAQAQSGAQGQNATSLGGMAATKSKFSFADFAAQKAQAEFPVKVKQPQIGSFADFAQSQSPTPEQAEAESDLSAWLVQENRKNVLSGLEKRRGKKRDFASYDNVGPKEELVVAEIEFGQTYEIEAVSQAKITAPRDSNPQARQAKAQSRTRVQAQVKSSAQVKNSGPAQLKSPAQLKNSVPAQVGSQALSQSDAQAQCELGSNESSNIMVRPGIALGANDDKVNSLGQSLGQDADLGADQEAVSGVDQDKLSGGPVVKGVAEKVATGFETLERTGTGIGTGVGTVEQMYQRQSSLTDEPDHEQDTFNDSEEKPQCVDLYLTYNYRSQANILAAAFDVISNNHDVIRRPLLAKRTDIDLSQMVTLEDPNREQFEANASKEKMLATFERLSALPHINQHRQRIVEDMSKFKMGSRDEVASHPEYLSTMKPVVVHVPNVTAEAQFVIRTILDIQKLNTQASIAVLYRTHFAASKIEDELLRAEIPYRVVGAVSFFARKEIQDALAYMRLRVNPDDDLALRRVINVPSRKFGAKRMELLESLARRDHCSLFQALLRNSNNENLYKRNRVNEFVQAILELNDAPLKDAAQDFELVMAKSGYEEWLKQQGEDERLDNLATLKKHIVDYVDFQGEEVNLADFLYSVMLLTEADDADRDRKEVQLMTIHCAKGLEFDYVFLVSVNEAIFPSRKSISANNIEEERRLMYVAMTRARKQLIISEAGGCIYMYVPGTLMHGQNSTVMLERKPSRFLQEIQAEHYDELGAQLLVKREALEAKHSQNQSADTQAVGYAQNRQLMLQGPQNAGQVGPALTAANNFGAPKGFKFPVGSIIKHAVFGEGQIMACDEQSAEYEIFFTKIKRKRNLTALVANRNLELVKLPDHIAQPHPAQLSAQGPAQVLAQGSAQAKSALSLANSASAYGVASGLPDLPLGRAGTPALGRAGTPTLGAVSPLAVPGGTAPGATGAFQAGTAGNMGTGRTVQNVQGAGNAGTHKLNYVLPEGAPYFDPPQMEPVDEPFQIDDFYLPDDVPDGFDDEEAIHFSLEPQDKDPHHD